MMGRKKTAAMGAVALMAVMAAFVIPCGTDDVSAALVGAGTQSSPFTEFDTTAETAFEDWGGRTAYIMLGTTISISSVEGDDPFPYEYHVNDPAHSGTWSSGVWSKAIASTTAVTIESVTEYDNASRTVTFIPVVIPEVSDAVVIAGTAYSATVAPEGSTVTVSGADWLTASGNVISGTPVTPGTYTVTVSCGGQSATCTIKVVSKLDVTNSPAGGLIVMPK